MRPFQASLMAASLHWPCLPNFSTIDFANFKTVSFSVEVKKKSIKGEWAGPRAGAGEGKGRMPRMVPMLAQI